MRGQIPTLCLPPRYPLPTYEHLYSRCQAIYSDTSVAPHHLVCFALHPSALSCGPNRTASLASVEPSSPSHGHLPRHLFSLRQANSQPLPTDVSHHLEGCPATVPPKNKTNKINFFLPWYNVEKKNNYLPRQAKKKARGGGINFLRLSLFLVGIKILQVYLTGLSDMPKL